MQNNLKFIFYILKVISTFQATQTEAMALKYSKNLILLAYLV